MRCDGRSQIGVGSNGRAENDTIRAPHRGCGIGLHAIGNAELGDTCQRNGGCVVRDNFAGNTAGASGAGYGAAD